MGVLLEYLDPITAVVEEEIVEPSGEVEEVAVAAVGEEVVVEAEAAVAEVAVEAEAALHLLPLPLPQHQNQKAPVFMTKDPSKLQTH